MDDPGLFIALHLGHASIMNRDLDRTKLELSHLFFHDVEPFLIVVRDIGRGCCFYAHDIMDLLMRTKVYRLKSCGQEKLCEKMAWRLVPDFDR